MSGRRWLSLAFALWLAGCASTPETHFHTLVPTDPLAPAEGVQPNKGPRILMETIRVPEAVDQPQWMVRLPDESLVMLEQERWTSALPDELYNGLLTVLHERFGAVDARSPGAGSPQWRIRIDVSRFEMRPGLAALEATWSVTPLEAGAETLRCSSYYRESAEPGLAAIAAAHRRIVVRLGEAIGDALRAMQAGRPATCPA